MIANIIFRTTITYLAIEGTKTITTKSQIPFQQHTLLWIPMLIWIIYPIINKIKQPKTQTTTPKQQAINQLIKQYLLRKR